MEAADALNDFIERNQSALWKYNCLCRDARSGDVVDEEKLIYGYHLYKKEADGYRDLRIEFDDAKYEEARYKKSKLIIDPYDDPEWVKKADPASAEGFYRPDRVAPVFVTGYQSTPVSPSIVIASK